MAGNQGAAAFWRSPRSIRFSLSRFFRQERQRVRQGFTSGQAISRDCERPREALSPRRVGSSGRGNFADRGYERTARQGSGRENRRRSGGNNSLRGCRARRTRRANRTSSSKLGRENDLLL